VRPFELVDFLYEDFVRSLSGSLSEAARALAVTLRLAPERGIPWSRVFSHEVTLAAPALVAEGFAGVTPSQVEAAVFAHMLAVLEAFGTDRIEDLQVPASSELLALLAAMRDGRDAALARISATPEEQVVTYEHADRTTRQAIGEEARILRLGEGDDNRRPNGVPFETYERVSFGKQAVGFPASFALAFVVDPSTSRLRALSGLLRGVWLGLQMADDVVDWEGDAARGGAWATALAGTGRTMDPAAVRPAVLEAGVLAQMLARSRRHFRGAERRAMALGATRLSAWAGERREKGERLLEGERAAPGYVGRRFSLGAWAAEVLQ
jgi:hypothetical protein